MPTEGDNLNRVFSRSSRYPHGIRRTVSVRRFLLIISLGLLPLLSLLDASPARAATITVNTLVDPGGPGVCSLRSAVQAANLDAVVNGCAPGFGADTITFSVTGTILLQSGEIAITSPLTIQGPGARNLLIDGNKSATGGNRRIFNINSVTATTVNISGVTLQNGRYTETDNTCSNGALGGGGVIIDGTSPTVNFTDVTFTGNTTNDGTSGACPPIGGGGLFVYGSDPVVNILRSTFTNNTADGANSANLLVGGGGIEISPFSGTGNVTIVNSTITQNRAIGYTGIIGGGVDSAYTNLLIASSTLYANTSAGLGGNYSNSNPIVGPVTTIRNSIFAGGAALGNPDISGLVTSGGYNIVQNNAGVVGLVGTDQTGASPNLIALANNGGQTDTNAFATTSIAYNRANPAGCTGSSGALTTDQRGTGFARVVNGRCDVGAYELIPAPTLTKAFSPSAVGPTVSSTVTVTFQNNSDQPLTISGTFTDTMPAGLTTTGTATTTCAGGVPGQTTNSMTLTGGTIPAGVVVSVNPPVSVTPGTCTLSIQVSGPTPGSYNNTIAAGDLVTTTAGPNTAGTNAALLILTPPSIAKSFATNPVAIGVPTALTFTLTNSNPVALSGMQFTDNLPANLVIATPLTTGGTCTGVTFSGTTVAGGGVVQVTSGNIPASSSCTVTVNVVSNLVGNYPNTVSGVTTTQTPVAGTGANNTLSVTGVSASIAKAFAPNPISVGTNSTLTFTLGNTNAIPLTGVNFTDTLNADVTVASPLTTGGTCTGVTFSGTTIAGSNTIQVTNATIPQNGSCTITVVVTSVVAGSYPNTTTGVTTTEVPTAGTGAPSVSLDVTATPPSATKVFAPTSISSGGTSTVTITISNTNAIAMAGISLSDTFPGTMQFATPLSFTNNCGGTITPAAAVGGNTFALAGGTIPANSTCTIIFDVTSTTPGDNVNTTGAVASSNAGNGGTASGTLNVVAPPTITKAFTPSSIATGGTSTLTITITNPAGNTVALTGVGVTDNLGAVGLQVAGTPAATNTCGGTFTPNAGDTALTLTGGTVASGGNCAISVAVTGTTAGDHLNTTGNVTSTSGGNGGTASATLTIVAPPTIAKAFTPTSIAPGGTSTLTITITNPAGNTVALTGVGVTDNLTTANMQVAGTPASTNTCGGTFAPNAGDTTLTLTGGTVPVGGSCAISVAVTSNTTGVQTNTTGAVTSTNGGNGGTATATLTVGAPPTVTKAFAPTSIASGGTSSVTITITNPAANAFGLTGVSLSDTFPAGMVFAATPNLVTTCGGTLTPLGGNNGFTFTGGALAQNASCTITFDVTSTTAGDNVNTTGTVGTTETGIGATATATLNVVVAPTIAKVFTPATIASGGTSTLTITITNPAGNTVALTGVGVTDNLGAASLQVAGTPAATNTCGGTFAPNAGDTALTLTGGTIPVGGNCAISVAITATTAGNHVNTTGNVTSTNGGNGGTANATLIVVAGPTITKAFAPTAIQPGGTSTLTITITNTAGNTVALTGVGVTDNLTAANMQVAGTPAATNTCGGTFTPNAGDTTLTLTGGTVPVGGSCAISVAVTSSTPGVQTNTTGTVTSTNGGTGGTATATLTVSAPPAVTKAFTPTSIASGGTSSVTITITNPAVNAFGLTGVSISDTFPAGMVFAATPNLATTCGGTLTPLGGNNGFTFTGGTLAQNGSCTITFAVTSTTAGDNVNTTGAVSATESGAGLTASATLNVVAAPTVAKAFAPTSIASGGTSTLTITISNPAGNTVALTGVGVTDNLGAASLQVAGTPAAANTCGGTFTPNAGDTTLTLTGGTVPVGGSCAISVAITATTAGNHVNTTGNVTSTNGGNGGTATATLNVVAGPTITKAFAPTFIQPGGTSTLTITIANPAGNTVALTGVGVTDNLVPANMQVAGTPAAANTCGGTFTPNAGDTTLTLTGGTVPVGGSCAISVVVTSSTPGLQTNTTGNVTSTNGGNGGTATANLEVVQPPAIAKAFTPAAIGSGGVSQMTITITNPNTLRALSGIAFTDTFPAGLTIAGTPGLVNTCGGTITPAVAAGNTALNLTGGSIPAGVNCTIQVNVTSTTVGNAVNTTGNITSTEGGAGNTATATLNVTAGLAPANIAKSFTPANIASGGTSTLTITITNPNTGAALTGVTFNDAFPAGLTIAAPLTTTNTCGGTFSPALAAGGTAVNLSGGTVAANGTCTITVAVTSTTLGNAVNTTGNVTSTNGGAGNTATATLNVSTTVAPNVTKTFAPTGIASGGTSTLTITITNPNAGTALTGVGITDPFPAGLSMATPLNVNNTCGGTLNPAPAVGNTSFTLSGGTIAAGGSCTITADITSTTIGNAVNTTQAVTSTEGGTGNSASATLAVLQPPTIVKSFTPANIASGGTSALAITVTNPNAGVALTGVGFTDTFPGGVSIATPLIVNNTCGGTLTPTPVVGGTAINLSGGTVAAGGSCTVTVNVTSATLGLVTNTTSAVVSTNAGTGGTASATLDVTTTAAPSITKAFTPATIPSGGTSTLTITVTNPNGSIALNGVAFNDAFPAGVSIATPLTTTNTCGGTFTPALAVGGTAINLSGATIAANSSCTITAVVTSTTLGNAVNTTNNVTSTTAGATTGNTATATLNVVAFVPPSITKSFTPAQIASGGVSQMTITITNPNPATTLTSVSVTDTFPAGMSMANPPNFTSTCSGLITPAAAAGNTSLSLTGADMAGGAACTITVSVTSSTAGDAVNTTSPVSATNAGAGNTASATLTVGQGGGGTGGVGVVDPAISKIGVLEPGKVGLPGEQITWVITVTNRGGITAQNVTITDAVIPELRIDSIDTTKGNYTITGQTVTFSIGTLSPGEIVSMRIVTTVLKNPSAPAISNNACINTSNASTRCSESQITPPSKLPSTGYAVADSQDNTGVVILGGLGVLMLVAAAARIIRRKR